MIFVNSLLFSFRDIDINIGFDFLYFLFYDYFVNSRGNWKN